MMDSIDSAVSIADVRIALREALSPKFGVRDAATMARMVIMSLKDWDLPHLLADENREASDFIKGRSREILAALLADMPIQYVLGETSFYGLALKVAPGVLIPRPETQELVDLIVKENRQSDLKVLDLCTGSGAIAVALARNLPFADIDALDIAPEAIETASQNARNLKVRINIIRQDIFKFSPENKYDIIVSNPPYVDESEITDMEPNVVKYEPRLAIFVPDDNPLLFYRRIATIGEEALKCGGRLYLEINPRHDKELKVLLESHGYEKVEIIKDLHGKSRFCKAIRP